jgi:hypothetical protein
MSVPRIYCAAAARAIRELDRCSLGAPNSGQDKDDWQTARRLLFALLDRNSYELSAAGRLTKRTEGHR